MIFDGAQPRDPLLSPHIAIAMYIRVRRTSLSGQGACFGMRFFRKFWKFCHCLTFVSA